MEINKRENIGWIDLLRVTACFLVVFAHCCDPFVARFDTDRPTFLQGCALGSAVRCCVPLFVMMTGVLLFPVRNGMSEFYKKRIGRIVVPLIFWSVMLPVLYFIYLNYITTTDNPTIDMSAFTLEMTITKIWTFIFNFNYDTTPLWYLYMLAFYDQKKGPATALSVIGFLILCAVAGLYMMISLRKEDQA